MADKKIINKDTLNFKPFNRYGKVIPGMSWHKISYDDDTHIGSYISYLALLNLVTITEISFFNFTSFSRI